jgi:distribution and morphology protein 34
MTGSRGMLAAKQALVVPMLLRLSHFRLSSYVVLVVSKQKGITLVFKTDPLQNVDINSTFDSIAVIQSFIQREIEGQLRQMFREDLPGIIHRLSQQWVKAKVEAPYLTKFPPSPPSPEPVTMVMSAPDLRTLYQHRRPNTRPPSVAYTMASGIRPLYPRVRTSSGSSITSTVQSRARHSDSPDPSPSTDPPESTFPEIENFDPTYGLRPEGLPTKSVFRSFGRLFANPGRGLADLAEENTDEEDDDAIGDDGTSYGWQDSVPGFTSAEPSVLGDSSPGTSTGVEYESVPAVGGGTVMRPRVFHAHSRVHPMTDRSTSLAPTSTSRLTRAALRQLPRADLPHRPHSLYNPYFPPLGAADRFAPAPTVHSYRHYRDRDPFEAPTPPLYHSPPRRPLSPSSHHTHGSSSHTVPTPPSTEALHPAPRERTRRASIASVSVATTSDTDARIVLRPALHGALSALATLAHSNHTLSPYTRSPSHFTVRSGPRSAPPAPPPAPPRARRRRTHMLGAAAKAKAKAKEREKEDVGGGVEEGWGESGSPPPSEFDAEDMDRYFRTRDELASVAAESEPAVLSGHASLPYGLSRGHDRAQVRVHHHARMSDSGDAYSRRRHAYAHRE